MRWRRRGYEDEKLHRETDSLKKKTNYPKSKINNTQKNSTSNSCGDKRERVNHI